MTRAQRFAWVSGLLLAFACAATAEDIKFAVIGDFGKGAETHKVKDLIASWSPDFVITVGDNAYSKDQDRGRPNAFELDVVPSFGAFIAAGKFFPALGNHDYGAPGSGNNPERVKGYLDTLKPPLNGPGAGRYYEFARGPVHFFALNSNQYEPDGGIRFYGRQGDWLRDRLAAATEPFKVVYFHHPPYTGTTRNKPTLEMRWPFKEWGVSLVFSGHTHNHQRFKRRGLFYVVNGLGGDSTDLLPENENIPGLERFPPYPTSPSDRKFGAMLVEASDTQMKLTAFTVKIVNNSVQGETRDQFTIAANAPIPAPIYRDLRNGSTGADVAAWQDFLFERHLLANEPDRSFGTNTRAATQRFQQEQHLQITGVLDPATRDTARAFGFKPMEDPNPN